MLTSIFDKIKTILGNRAIVDCDENKNMIIINPPLITNMVCSGFYLEYIRDSKWNDLIIPNGIKINLIGWLIDTKDNKLGGDLWCLNWMKEKYDIIDNCVKCDNVILIHK